MQIDNYSYLAKFRIYRPHEKIIFSLITLIFAISSNSIIISTLILFFNSLILIKLNNTDKKVYIKMLMIPIVFLIIGIISILIEVSNTKENLIYYIPFGKYYLGSTYIGLIKASKLFFKALAALSCMYFITLTTPLMDTLTFLRKMKVPKLFNELMTLIYRFIFIILESINDVYTAQNARLGYINLKLSFNSMAKLISSSLIKSLKKANDIYTAMESRLYNGEIIVLDRDFIVNKKLNFLFFTIDLILFLLLVLNILKGGILI